MFYSEMSGSNAVKHRWGSSGSDDQKSNVHSHDQWTSSQVQPYWSTAEVEVFGSTIM